MPTVKRLLCGLIFFATALASSSWLIAQAQSTDNKPKPTASISGRVTVGEKPAPGVTVAASVPGSMQLLAQAVSDAEGKYHINGLIPGQINVAAVAPTYVTPASPMFGQGRMITLSADENVEGVDFKLARGGVITGRITDPDGKPLIEERVTLTAVDDNGQPARVNYNRPVNPMINSTDDRGIYRLYGVAAGRYKVSVGSDAGRIASLTTGYYQKTYHPDTTDASKAAIVELSEGGEAKNIDINVGARSQTYVVTGRVIDADTSQPIAGVGYSFSVLQQNQGQTYAAGSSSPQTPTNSKGEFRLEGVAPGRYALTVASYGSYPATSDQPKVYSDPVTFEVVDSDVSNIEVKAQRGLSISGVVITEGITTQAALASVSKLIVAGFMEPSSNNIQGFFNSTTSAIGADGTFQLDGLRPGRVSLGIGGGGAVTKGITVLRIVSDRELPNHRIDLAPGQNVSGVRIYLTYGSAVIKGEVKIEGGTLPSDALMFVTLLRENQGVQVSGGQVDARGHFVITNIPAGTYEATLQIMSLGGNGFPRGLPRMQKQIVNVSDVGESQITFTLDLTPKEGGPE